MQKFLLPLAVVILSPMAALAMPVVGDMIGTDAETAKAALEKAGCVADKFEAEDGMIEASCTDSATGAAMDIVIDPASGKITDIKAGD